MLGPAPPTLHFTPVSLSLPQAPAAAGPAHAGVPLSRTPTRGTVPSLYIHVPFCFHKCHYCDFYSIVDTRDRQDAFVDRLCHELSALAPWAAAPLSTIFVGGGTPSLLAVPLWQRLLAHLNASFDLSLIKKGRGEFTVECNPETVTHDLADTLVAGGVNRASIGAQSFDPRHLKTLERWHDPANVPRALAALRRAGIPRSSVDLIFGVPGQSLTDWSRDLDLALDLNLRHISCYGLTYEPGTAMTARLRRGDFTPADEDTEAAMFALTQRRLARAGLVRYEVSNFARPGHQSAHNLAYWLQHQWLAAGPSASAHVAGMRWKNAPRLDDYLSRDFDGFAPIMDFEGPDPRRALAERLMTGLRLADGLCARELLRDARAIDPAAVARLRRAADRAASRCHLAASDGRWSLTEPGMLLSQSIIVDFMSALDPAT
jgi:oxygen-independent coproporphyrinogen III oxidase